MKRFTTEEFIEKAQKLHGDKYDYSKVEYANAISKISIICPEHGEFWQIPNNHLRGCGCPKCAKELASKKFLKAKEQFILDAKSVHGDKYDYSKVEYINNSTKVCIICHEHGEFWQRPNDHLNGKGCPKCAGNFLDREYFIEKAKFIHNDKYDYSKVQYVNSNTKVCIICPEHGEFWQTPNNHLRGCGCPKCVGNHIPNSDEWIEKAKQVHGDKYDYSKVQYVNSNTKVCIICPKHGEFYQTPGSHLNGNGCSKCNMSHLERDIMQFFDRHGIEYEYQKRFDWLGKMSLDFYLPKYNIAIECQGRQHYEPVKQFGGEDEYKKTQKRDKKKKLFCEEHGIKLRYYY